LVKYGEVRRGRLGVAIQNSTTELAEAMGLPGNQSGSVLPMTKEKMIAA
jgi:hypothetical protein